MTYQKNGDYYIPELTIDSKNEPLRKYGLMRKRFMMEEKSTLYTMMLLEGSLESHLIETQEAAEQQLEILISDLVKQEG
ncbi:TnpV protein, partial [Serratia marcescens]|uniref:TnpV protein n=1 Tax=Serratia marcescens TaxID=615 RepID=UPI0034D1A8AF